MSGLALPNVQSLSCPTSVLAIARVLSRVRARPKSASFTIDDDNISNGDGDDGGDDGGVV